MENTKIILVCTIFIAFISCNNKCDEEYKYLKNDLYIKNDTIFLLQKGEWVESNNEIITLKHYDPFVVYANETKILNNVIDYQSFEKHEDYYTDSFNIYFHNSFPAFYMGFFEKRGKNTGNSRITHRRIKIWQRKTG